MARSRGSARRPCRSDRLSAVDCPGWTHLGPETVKCRAVRFFATVFLPPTPPARVAAALAAALAPYYRDDYTRGPYDPSATWDRWQPARDSVAFPLLPRGLDRLRPGRRRGALPAPHAAAGLPPG